MNKTTVVYHSADFDGIFCREIARKFLPEAELIGWDYGDPTPAKATLDGTEALYLMDISVPDLMDHPKLIWIDHHKSAMEKYEVDPYGTSTSDFPGPRKTPIPGYRIDGVAACRLAWQWFANTLGVGNMAYISTLDKRDFVQRRVTEPLAVRLAGEYDIWDKRDPDAELFQHGLRSRELNSVTWKYLLGDDLVTGQHCVSDLLDGGRVLQYARTQENASIIKDIGFDLEWEGLKFLACNAARYNSHLFTAGLTPEHDACFGFKWTGKTWSVSLYHAPGKEHHDLSTIAVKYGGGGHRGACGFTINELTFIKIGGGGR